MLFGGSFSHSLDSFSGTTALDYDANGNLIYQGNAMPGSSKGSAVWQIKRFTYTSGNLSDIQYADGNMNFDNIWNDRASLLYS